MNKIFILTCLSLSISALATTPKVELTSTEVNVNASSAVVVRSSKTPSIVELTFRVPMQNSVCERYETRHVLRTSGFDCGYDISVRYIRSRDCVKTNESGRCVQYVESNREERIETPRTCMVPETYCAEYGTATTYEKNTMKINFKKLSPLGGSETETFKIEADQKSYGSARVDYIVKPLDTLKEYKVKQKRVLWIKLDSYIVEEK